MKNQIKKKEKDPDKTNFRQRAKTSMLGSGLTMDGADFARMADELRALAVQHDVEDGVLCTTCKLSIQEVRILRESFEFCDADGSGSIDREELTVVLKNLGCTPTTAAQKSAFGKVLERPEYRFLRCCGGCTSQVL
jgi:hypothetical protein